MHAVPPQVRNQRSRLQKPRLFYGWWIVAVCFVCLFIDFGVGFYASGPLLKPLMAEFGWSRTQVAAIMTLFLVITGLSGPLIGRLIRSYGPRKVMAGGALFAGLCIALLSLTQTLWQLYALYILATLGLSGAGIVPTGAVVANWFSRRRGLAIGVTIGGVSAGGLTLALLSGQLVSTLGWRPTYLVMALLTWVLVVPAVMLVLRARPEEMGLAPDGLDKRVSALGGGGGSPVGGLTLAQAVKTPAFWLIALGLMLAQLGAFGVLGLTVPYFTDLQVKETTAATVLGVMAGASALGKLTFGYLSDHMPVRYVAVLSFSLQGAGVVLLLLVPIEPLSLMWPSAVLCGFAMGGNPSLQPLLVADRFGLAFFASIFGLVILFGYLGGAMGPFMAAYTYDAFQTYRWAFMIFLGLYGVAILAILLAWLTKHNLLPRRS